MSRPTIHDYVTILERVFLLETVPPWHTNRISRLIKTPKLHLGDTGLACALLGVDTLNPYWAEQVEIQRRAADAWIARADGRNDEAVTLMQSAADLEDATDKSPVTPGALLPAREMLGDPLLELNQPAKALEAYEHSLKDSPNRRNGRAGVGRAKPSK